MITGLQRGRAYGAESGFQECCRSMAGNCGHTPSPKPCQKPNIGLALKILAPHRYIISFNALNIEYCPERIRSCDWTFLFPFRVFRAPPGRGQSLAFGRRAPRRTRGRVNSPSGVRLIPHGLLRRGAVACARGSFRTGNARSPIPTESFR